MNFERSSIAALNDALLRLEAGFADLPAFEPASLDDESIDILNDVADRLTDNFPYQHPLYAGQMLKPPHPLARAAYQLAMWLNPNNHALDGGRASSAMEKEAVAELAGMVGWGDHLGHLCGGGTMANLEALWVAGRATDNKTIVASSQAHYTHSRISDVLQLPFATVDVDAHGRMCMDNLEQTLQRNDVGTVVATLGTTGLGAVDPLPEILALQERYGFRIHADAAYGGYFKLVDNLADDSAAAFGCMQAVDSIVIDPHKHGLQPYGCGCVLFKDPGAGQLYKHESPYTYFTSDELHLGEITLECSRAGASAVALWATQQLLPPVPGGRFAADLGRSRQAALDLHTYLAGHPGFRPLSVPDLDIVVWAPEAATSAAMSERSRRAFNAAAEQHLHLALLKVPVAIARASWDDAVRYDSDTVLCLRTTLMKPEHLTWLKEIQNILDTIAGQ